MKKILVVALLGAFSVLAETPNVPPPEKGAPEVRTAPTPPPARPKLTRREQKDLIAKLPDKHREFLTNVEPIILPDELETFLRLDTDAQRDLFIEDFWRRRDIAQGTTNHSFRKEYEYRLEWARDNLGSISSDRGKILLIHGEPQGRWQIDCPKIFQPLDIWFYSFIESLQRREMFFVFYIPRGRRDYRMYNPIGGQDGPAELASGDIVMSRGGGTGNPIFECKDGEVILGALRRAEETKMDLHKAFTPPKMETEDVKAMARSLVVATHGVPKLNTEVTIQFPAGNGKQTDAQMTILVPRAEVKANAVTGVPVYSVDVVGEVLRENQIYEKFRYRFDFPGDTKDEKLPLVVDRLLRPGTYTTRLKITDVTSTAEAIVERELIVPAVELPAEEKLARNEATSAIEDIRRIMDARETHLRIVPLPEDVISGIQTIDTIATGNAIKSVEFWLDGKRVATRRQPPFALDLDFGNVPKVRKIRAVALNGNGETVGGDELTVNTGTDPFRIRIAHPRVAPKISGPTRVEVDVRVPEGKELAGVELFWNEQRVATLYDPPFVQTVNIPSTDGVGYLRAVASLKEEESNTIEDVVFVNTPEFMEEVNVHLVEMPTTVLDGGKPRNDLPPSAFQVLDEGKPVTLAKFEHVKNLPLAIGMAVDTSGSMQSRMAEAQRTGAQFFQNVMRKGDKAFLVGFDSMPHVVQKWSPSVTDMQAALAKLRPEESTALYDAIVFSLYNFVGVKGQKALVLLTDGKDTVSKFGFDQALEYARRAAVPIYAIGLGIRGTEMDVKSKLSKFTSETGGNVYYIDNASELSKIYDDIQNELRAQYVLGFYPDAAAVKPGGPWRELTVKVAEGKAKTIRGYYP